MTNHIDSHIILTPSGAFEAFSSSEPTPKQLALQLLLSEGTTLSKAKWLESHAEQWLIEFEENGWIEVMPKPLPAPTLPLDQFLPYVVASLSGSRRAAIASEEGFCLARIGYTQEEAETLSVAAADFSGFLRRQQQRGWRVEGQAVSFFKNIHMLMPSTSLIFLWVNGDGYILMIEDEPLTNNRAFVELIWSIKVSGLRRFIDNGVTAVAE